MKYPLTRLIEETGSNILVKWTFLAILDYVYISAKYVCKITNLNASSQIVKDAKICKIDIKIEILYFSYY